MLAQASASNFLEARLFTYIHSSKKVRCVPTVYCVPRLHSTCDRSIPIILECDDMRATFFDLSPAVIEGKSTQGKTGSALLVYKVFICAQDMAPSVIYIDQVDQVFQATKKKKGADTGTAPSRIKKDLQAAINQVKRFDEANEQDRILFIGCTSRPFADGVDIAGLKDSFDEKVWVSFPEYGSRVVLWQRFMEDHGVTVDPVKLNISTLARVSEGYPAGSIKQTVDRVLTARRVQQLKNRPLKVQEFIGKKSLISSEPLTTSSRARRPEKMQRTHHPRLQRPRRRGKANKGFPS
eukprot:s5556_g3.t1